MRRAAKIDSNQPEIVAYLRKLGWSVFSTAAIGKGFPDIIAGRPGCCALIEIKDGKKPPSARKLTKDEQIFAEEWTGPLIVALSPEDAARKLNELIRGWA